MRGIGVVRLVGPEICPDRLERSLVFAGVDLDMNSFLSSCKRREQRRYQNKPQIFADEYK
jgi:hypothetical protein